MTPGLSLNMKISSSMSDGPNVQFLLVGRDTSLTLSITWAAVTIKIVGLVFVILKAGNNWFWTWDKFNNQLYLTGKMFLPSSSTRNSKPFFLKISMFSMSTFSLTAVRWSFWGLQTANKKQHKNRSLTSKKGNFLKTQRNMYDLI